MDWTPYKGGKGQVWIVDSWSASFMTRPLRANSSVLTLSRPGGELATEGKEMRVLCAVGLLVVVIGLMGAIPTSGKSMYVIEGRCNFKARETGVRSG